MAFSPTQAALEGFRLVGRRPVSFLAWVLVVALEFATVLAAISWAWGPDLAVLMTARTLGVADFAPYLFRFALAMVAAVPVFVVLHAVFMGAVYRSVVQPTQKDFGYLRLGGDELRLILLQLLLGLLWWAVLAVVMAVIFCTRAAPIQPGVALLIDLVAVVAGIWIAILLGVRLSLAGPFIVARGRISLGDAWRLTRRRFWPLFLVGLLALLLASAASMVSQTFMQPFTQLLVAPFQAGDANAVWTSGPNPFPALKANAALFSLLGVLTAAMVTFQSVIQTAPFAAAYRDIMEGG